MSEIQAVITLHHHQNFTAAQYLFSNYDQAYETFQEILKLMREKVDRPFNFTHKGGESAIICTEFVEASVAKWSDAMALVSSMTEAQLIAQVSAEVKAQQATRHLARFQQPVR